MSTYFGWQRVIWFDQLLIQYEIFWRGMHYELMHYELVYCTCRRSILKFLFDGRFILRKAEDAEWRITL